MTEFYIGISKQIFCDTIRAIEAQERIDEMSRVALEQVTGNRLENGYNNRILYIQIFYLLANLTNDTGKDSWIMYFCDWLKYGKDYKPGCCKDLDGNDIDLSTPESLYDFLVRIKDNEHKG